MNGRGKSERGASLVEYALIVATVAVAALGAVALGPKIAAAFESNACDEAKGYYCCKPDDPKYADNCSTLGPVRVSLPAPRAT